MKLKIINNLSDKEWDNLIDNFKTKSLFHQSSWLNFLKETQKAQIIKFEIHDDDKIIGYFVGMLEKKWLFKIFSSPRPGCNTPHMGPIVNNDFNQQEFIKAIEDWCKKEKIDLLEIASPFLSPEIMKRNKFSHRQGITYIVDLFEDEKKMWLNLKKKSCRYAIHKAEKNGLIAENTNNPKIVDEYYNQLREVFIKQKLVPTYPKERVATLFKCLTNSMFSIWVKHQDEIIATGFFPYNSRIVYFFGGASWLKYQHLCPNELMHWFLMKLAAQKGLKYYDMGGGGSFKSKFGGELKKTYRYYKSYNYLVRISRFLYQYKFKILQKIKGLKNGKLSK